MMGFFPSDYLLHVSIDFTVQVNCSYRKSPKEQDSITPSIGHIIDIGFLVVDVCCLGRK